MSGEEGSLGEIRKALAGLTRRLDSLAAAVGVATRSGEAPGALVDEATRGRLAALAHLLGLSRERTPDEARLLALDAALLHARADCAAVFVAEGDRLAVAAQRGFAAAMGAGSIPGIVGRALELRDVVHTAPGVGGPDPVLAEAGVLAAVALPILAASGAAAGVLLVGRRRPAPLDAEGIGPLLVIADRLAPGRPRGGAEAPEHGDGSVLEALLAAGLDVRRTAAVVARHAAARLGAAAVAVLVRAADGFELAGSHGLSSDAGPPPEGGMARLAAALAAGPAPGGDVPADAALGRWLGTPVRAVLPLGTDDGPIAFLVAGAPGPCASTLPAAFERLATLALHDAWQHAQAVAVPALTTMTPPAGEVTPAPLGEIANLLAVVLGRLAAVRDRLAEPETARELAVAEEAAWRVAEAVRQLLGFRGSAADPGAAPLELAPLVRDAVRAAERRWASDGGPPIVLELETVPVVRGNADELRHALDHLLQNARESGMDGRAPIRVRLSWDGVGRVEIGIADQGRGMDEATRTRAGEPFFTTKGPGRLGVGLAVARAAATRHRGDLAIDTAPGRGTTVRLRLPAGAPAGARRVAAGVARGARVRVLVVEDDPAVRESVAEALGLAGYAVRTAESGVEAVAALRREAMDAVITDLALPSGSGLEVARLAKEARPETRVILITAWPGRVDAASLDRHGVDAVIEKPVGLDSLCTTLAALITRRPASPA